MGARATSTFGRLLRLLAALLLAMMFLVALAFRAFGVGAGGATYADLVAGNVALARVPEGAALRDGLDLRRDDAPPAGARGPLLPFQRTIVARVVRLHGPGTQVLFSGKPDSRVWVRPAGDAGWIGVPVPSFVEETVGMTFGLALAGLVLSFLLAAWYARGLTRPLRRLAAVAPALARGEVPAAAIDDRGPREVVALEAALRGAAAEVRLAARDRELVLAGVSHDLRTPLARLRVALELQAQLPRPERDALHADIDAMDAIIGQFLDYVRDGRDEAPQAVDVADLLDAAIAEAARVGIAWERRGLDSLPWTCRPLSLRRALRNLVHNAEVHGRPPFALGLEVGEGGARIVVADGGPGPPREFLPVAGRPFARPEGARDGASGIGLGLSLAARVMQAHGGQLELRHPPEGGFEAVLAWPALAPVR